MTSQEKMTLLQVSDVSFTFLNAKTAAVSNLSVEIKMGEMTSLIGPNGCGKSTLMGLCAGMFKPTIGTVSYDSKIQTSGYVPVYGLGYLPETLEVWESVTVYEYLSYIGRVFSLENLKDSIVDLSRELFIDEVLSTPVSQLSKGMRHRALLAGVLLKNPDILILDEPTDGLDPVQRVKILTFLKKLSRNRAVFISTHQLEDLEPFFDRTLVMKSGKLILDTTPQELARHGKGDVHLAYRVMMTNKGKKL